jgi:hypothetical protein
VYVPHYQREHGRGKDHDKGQKGQKGQGKDRKDR